MARDRKSSHSEGKVKVGVIRMILTFLKFPQDSRKSAQAVEVEKESSVRIGLDKVKEAKLNAKLIKLSTEDARERRSHSTETESQIVKPTNREKRSRRSLDNREGGEECATKEDFIANAKTQPCMFYAKGYCMRGATCWFKHQKSADDSPVQRSFEEETRKSREPRNMLLRVVDRTVTVKTLDLEEYFSNFGEVVEVKFTGLCQEGWSNFNVEVRWKDTVALRALKKQFHTIKGTDVVVKPSGSRESGSCSLKGKEEKNPVQEREICSSWGRDGKRSRNAKRGRSRSEESNTSKRNNKEGRNWKGSSVLRMDKEIAIGSKVIKLEKLQEETCQKGLVPDAKSEYTSKRERGKACVGNISNDQEVKVKKEADLDTRRSDADREEPKESSHLTRIFKGAQGNKVSR